jgi:hypothetical protein
MIRLLVVIGLTCAWLGEANAGLAFGQPTLWAGNGTSVGSTWASQSDGAGTNPPNLNGNRTLDNFSLSSPAAINGATWFGVYLDLDPASGGLVDGTPNTASWVVRFQADNGGVPGMVLVSTTQPAAQVSTQVVGTGLLGNSVVTVYEFSIVFPMPLQAAANTAYWFSPLSLATDFLPFFAWIEGTGGDGQSFQTAFTNTVVTDTFIRDGDRAFSLASVPEPATLLLIGAALVAVRALRGRRARAK